MLRKVIKFISLLLCFCLIFEQTGFAQASGQLGIAGYLQGLRPAFIQDKFRPLHLRFLSYDTQTNNFKLLLDKGDERNLQTPKIEETTKTLLNYFLVGITLPNRSFWVNLRPDAEDNIIEPELAQTDVGRILLEADLQLKKDTAKFTSPDTPEGKQYWDKLYKKAEELFGNENITIPTLTRPWIVPQEIIIRETKDNAYIYKATLKVLLEEDYLNNATNAINAMDSIYTFKDLRLKALNVYSSELIRHLIIPKLTQEVNTAKRYASLRQVYYSLILAQWFKQRFYGKGGFYSSLIDKKNLNGLTSKASWSKTTYFNEYQRSFKEGEYNIKEPVYTPYGQVLRSYMSGGIVPIFAVFPEPGQTKTDINTGALFTSVKAQDSRDGVGSKYLLYTAVDIGPTGDMKAIYLQASSTENSFPQEDAEAKKEAGVGSQAASSAVGVKDEGWQGRKDKVDRILKRYSENSLWNGIYNRVREKAAEIMIADKDRYAGVSYHNGYHIKEMLEFFDGVLSYGRITFANPKASPWLIRLAILCHDLGYFQAEEGQNQNKYAVGHVDRSIKIAKELQRDLGLDKIDLNDEMLSAIQYMIDKTRLRLVFGREKGDFIEEIEKENQVYKELIELKDESNIIILSENSREFLSKFFGIEIDLNNLQHRKLIVETHNLILDAMLGARILAVADIFGHSETNPYLAALLQPEFAHDESPAGKDTRFEQIANTPDFAKLTLRNRLAYVLGVDSLDSEKQNKLERFYNHPLALYHKIPPKIIESRRKNIELMETVNKCINVLKEGKNIEPTKEKLEGFIKQGEQKGIFDAVVKESLEAEIQKFVQEGEAKIINPSQIEETAGKVASSPAGELEEGASKQQTINQELLTSIIAQAKETEFTEISDSYDYLVIKLGDSGYVLKVPQPRDGNDERREREFKFAKENFGNRVAGEIIRNVRIPKNKFKLKREFPVTVKIDYNTGEVVFPSLIVSPEFRGIQEVLTELADKQDKESIKKIRDDLFLLFEEAAQKGLSLKAKVTSFGVSKEGKVYLYDYGDIRKDGRIWRGSIEKELYLSWIIPAEAIKIFSAKDALDALEKRLKDIYADAQSSTNNASSAVGEQKSDDRGQKREEASSANGTVQPGVGEGSEVRDKIRGYYTNGAAYVTITVQTGRWKESFSGFLQSDLYGKEEIKLTTKENGGDDSFSLRAGVIKTNSFKLVTGRPDTFSFETWGTGQKYEISFTTKKSLSQSPPVPMFIPSPEQSDSNNFIAFGLNRKIAEQAVTKFDSAKQVQVEEVRTNKNTVSILSREKGAINGRLVQPISSGRIVVETPQGQFVLESFTIIGVKQEGSLLHIMNNRTRTEYHIKLINKTSSQGKQMTEDKASSAVGEVSEEGKKGGIDFRALPIVTQPSISPPSTVHSPQLNVSKISLDLDQEWQRIENMVNRGIIPSCQRIREYLEVSCQTQDLSQRIEKVLVCLADILRLEEEKVISTEPALREILVLLESDKPAQEIRIALSNIVVSAREPELIRQ